MAEQEELKLIVTLDDQASQRLAALQQTLQNAAQGITNAGQAVGTGAGHAARGAHAAAGGVHALHTSLNQLAARAGIFGGVFSTLSQHVVHFGKEVAAQVYDLEEYSKRLNQLSYSARDMGTNMAQLQSNLNRFTEVGIPIDRATAQLQKLSDVIADLSVIGSQSRRNLLVSNFLDPQEMQRTLGEFERARPEERIAVIQRAMQQTFDRWLAMSTPEKAAQMRRAVAAAMGVPDADKIISEGRRVEEWQERLRAQARAEAFRFEVNQNRAKIAVEETADAFKGILFQLLPINNAMDLMVQKAREFAHWMEEAQKKITDSMNKTPQQKYDELRAGIGPGGQKLEDMPAIQRGIQEAIRNYLREQGYGEKYGEKPVLPSGVKSTLDTVLPALVPPPLQPLLWLRGLYGRPPAVTPGMQGAAPPGVAAPGGMPSFPAYPGTGGAALPMHPGARPGGMQFFGGPYGGADTSGLRLTSGWDRMITDPNLIAMGARRIEDRRGTDSNTAATEDNTAQLKRLNDSLGSGGIAGTAPDLASQLGAGSIGRGVAGAGGGFPGAGGGAPGTGGGYTGGGGSQGGGYTGGGGQDGGGFTGGPYSSQPGQGTPGVPGQGIDGSAALQIAAQHLGQDEIRDEGKLSSWFQSQGIKISPRTTAWCAAFVNASLSQAGIKGTGSLAAASFYKYGTRVAPQNVQPGDIAVWPHHVAFLTGQRREGQLEVLGGNQGGTASGLGGVSQNFRSIAGMTIVRPPSGGVMPAATGGVDLAAQLGMGALTGGAQAGVDYTRSGGSGPATYRYNNPGGMYPGQAAQMFGSTGTGTIGGGHLIANFPTPVHGAAANMWNLANKNYVGMTVAQAMTKWSGGYRSVTGPGGNYDPNMRITREMTNDPNFMIPFMQAVSRGEAPGQYPLTQQGWQKAFQWFQAGRPGTGTGTAGIPPNAQPTQGVLPGGGAQMFQGLPGLVNPGQQGVPIILVGASPEVAQKLAEAQVKAANANTSTNAPTDAQGNRIWPSQGARDADLNAAEQDARRRLREAEGGAGRPEHWRQGVGGEPAGTREGAAARPGGPVQGDGTTGAAPPLPGTAGWFRMREERRVREERERQLRRDRRRGPNEAAPLGGAPMPEETKRRRAQEQADQAQRDLEEIERKKVEQEAERDSQRAKELTKERSSLIGRTAEEQKTYDDATDQEKREREERAREARDRGAILRGEKPEVRDTRPESERDPDKPGRGPKVDADGVRKVDNDGGGSRSVKGKIDTDVKVSDDRTTVKTSTSGDVLKNTGTSRSTQMRKAEAGPSHSATADTGEE